MLGEPRSQLGAAGLRLRGPDDHGWAGTRERRAARAGRELARGLASRTSEGRCGSCRRSSSACGEKLGVARARTGRRAVRPGPRSPRHPRAARRPEACCAKRRSRCARRGMTAMAVSGSVVGDTRACPSHASVTPPSERGREVVGMALEPEPSGSSSSRVASGAAAASPSAIAAAEEPSPRSSGIRLSERGSACPPGRRGARRRAPRDSSRPRGARPRPRPRRRRPRRRSPRARSRARRRLRHSRTLVRGWQRWRGRGSIIGSARLAPRRRSGSSRGRIALDAAGA